LPFTHHRRIGPFRGRRVYSLSRPGVQAWHAAIRKCHAKTLSALHRCPAGAHYRGRRTPGLLHGSVSGGRRAGARRGTRGECGMNRRMQRREFSTCQRPGRVLGARWVGMRPSQRPEMVAERRALRHKSAACSEAPSTSSSRGGIVWRGRRGARLTVSDLTVERRGPGVWTRGMSCLPAHLRRPGQPVIAGLGRGAPEALRSRRLQPAATMLLPNGDVEQRPARRRYGDLQPASTCSTWKNWCSRHGLKLLYDTRFCDVLRAGRPHPCCGGGEQVRALAIVQALRGRCSVTPMSAPGPGSGPSRCAPTSPRAGSTLRRKQVHLVCNSEEFPRDPRVVGRRAGVRGR